MAIIVRDKNYQEILIRIGELEKEIEEKKQELRKLKKKLKGYELSFRRLGGRQLGMVFSIKETDEEVEQ